MISIRRRSAVETSMKNDSSAAGRESSQAPSAGAGRVSPGRLSRNQAGIEMLLKLSKLVTQLSELHRKMRCDAAAPEESTAEV
jgi:hypothetical protein